MSCLLRISEAAALALHTTELLARNLDRYVTAQEIAETLSISEHHLQKVHQRLSKAGIIRSVRGPGGGVQLALEPENVTLMRIYEAIEGPYQPDQCLLNRSVCVRPSCILGTVSSQVNDLVREYFTKTTVAYLAEVDV